jgi:class 3 adenylate cyclase
MEITTAAAGPPEGESPAALQQLKETFGNENARQQRTILVVDQVGSTALKESQPQALWLPQLGWYYDTVTGIVLTMIEDALVKYQGDGIMVVCSSDRATEAIKAAIRVQEVIKAANGSRDTMGAVEFRVSIGIATGPVWGFVTPTGSPDYVGNVVDKAHRLCAAANPQAIFIDRSTGAAANMIRITSEVGEVFGRVPEEYQGDVQRAPLKGFARPVEYYEILWDHRVFGLKSAPVTESIRGAEKHTMTADKPLTPAAPAAARAERHHGEVKVWLDDRGAGFIIDAETDEEFYFNRNSLVYPEDIEKAKTEGARLAFVAQGVPASGKRRIASGVLVLGEDYEGILVGRPPGRSYGWILVNDSLGHQHRVFVPLPDETAGIKIGDRLSFRVSLGARGAYAADIHLAEEETAA